MFGYFQMQRSNLRSLGAALRAFFWSVPPSHLLTQKLLPNLTGCLSGKVVGAWISNADQKICKQMGSGLPKTKEKGVSLGNELG